MSDTPLPASSRPGPLIQDPDPGRSRVAPPPPQAPRVRSGLLSREPWPSRAREFLEDLRSEGVTFALMRGPGRVTGAELGRPGYADTPELGRPGSADTPELRILVAEADQARLGVLLERHGIGSGSSPLRISAVTELRYGGGRAWLRTGESEERILHRAVPVDGIPTATPADELLDTLLHCVLDLGSFPAGHRERLVELMGHLRMDPVLAGRAAERVQQELAPALPWSDLLAELVHEQWEALLARRRALRLHLLSKAPARSCVRWLANSSAHLVRRGGSPEPANQTTSLSASDRLTRKQIRGSGLLLAGRGISAALKFVSQLIIVRYLTTAEYGAWSYALAAVLFLRGFSTLGLNRAVARFLPIHLERGERQEFFGVMAFVFGSLVLGGALVVTLFYAFPEWVARLAGVAANQQLDILAIVIFLVPVDALDDFLTGVCAAFTSSRTIFVRRYILSPGLRTAVALLLVLFKADVRLLAYGYLLSGVAGLLYYGWMVRGEMLRRGLLQSGDLRFQLPARRVLSYTMPVMAADWGAVLMTTTGPLLLGYFQGANAVALFQVVIPLVTVTRIVAQSFGLLFEPAAARMSARSDPEGLRRLYWRSAAWVAVLSFPAFAACFTAAEPMTVLLFGERYRAAAPILSLLVAGNFLDAILGFNAPTLRVTGRVGWLVKSNIVAVLANVGLSLALIPSMGPLGAGIATATGAIVYAVLKQAGLSRAAGVPSFDSRYAAPYLAMAFVTVGLLAVRLALPADPYVLWAAAALATVAVLLPARATLSVGETFPELARLPFLKVLFG